MAEIDLMDRYPRTPRSLEARSANVTDEVRRISGQFGREYFDGDRLFGYGGYYYHPRFWQQTVRRFRDHYQLPADASILDVGCAKGFMLHDFRELMPRARLAGIDVSEYAIDQSLESVRPFLGVGNAKDLPYESKSFDLVTSINVVHNLPREECLQALAEIQRVSRRHSFVVVDAYRTETEKARLEDWIVTCKTYLHTEDWKQLFREAGYTGDYWWFVMPD